MRKFKIVIEAAVSEEIFEEKKRFFRAIPEFATLSEQEQEQLNINGFLGGLVSDLGDRAMESEIAFSVDDEFTIGKKTDTDYYAVVTTTEEK